MAHGGGYPATAMSRAVPSFAAPSSAPATMTTFDVAARTDCAALEYVRGPVEALLDAFLAERVDDIARMDPALRHVGQAVADLVAAPAKRLRPAFVYWGYRASGAPDDMAVLAPAAAVELLHTFALIHDDIMDRSPERRGGPAVHTALARAHRVAGDNGDPDWFGVGGAILAGDLAFVWADQLLDGAEVPGEALDRARTIFGALRVEVMAGQYLDLRLAASPCATEDDALRVALLKSGRYTVTRPLQMGAAIAGAGETVEEAICAYGDAVGIAFQLRDDVLGLFGDPAATGKGALEDLREGKRTLLMLRALQLSSDVGRKTLEGLLGNPDLDEADAELARDLIASSGALESIERLCVHQQEQARAALTPVATDARTALEELADLALFRET